jgi:hypothetical protein
MNKKMMCLGAALIAVTLAAVTVSADTVLTPQVASKAGISITPTNSGLVANVNYQFRNDGRTALLFTKSGAGACTVSVGAQATFGGLAVSSQTITVPATTGNVIAGPFPPAIFSDASGDVHFTMTDTVGLSVSVIKL